MGFKTVYNATATPRANGQVERYNQTILVSIAASMENEENWDKTVSRIHFAMNNIVNATTNKSPYEFFMRYRPRGVGEAFLKNAVVEDVNRQDALDEIRRVAHERITEQSKEKERYDKSKRKPRSYKVGELVLIRRANVSSNDGKSKKTLPRFKEPFVVTAVLPHDKYCIEDLPGACRSQKAYKGICAVDKMKLYTSVQDYEDGDTSSTGKNNRSNGSVLKTCHHQKKERKKEKRLNGQD